jgi:large subunit ribosomal protein LP0
MGGSKNKAGYFDKLKGLLEDYKSAFIVQIDTVSSQQMHEIRQSLRGQGVVLMGKNTMVCRPYPQGRKIARSERTTC